jgi:hypothetical protein
MTPHPMGGSPPSPPPLMRLYHGTDLASANAIIANGLDVAAAAIFNGSGEFWATSDRATADWFAMANPANGAPARLEFDLPLPVLFALLNVLPLRAFLHGADDYEFLPGAYQLLNQSMKNRQVVSPVP